MSVLSIQPTYPIFTDIDGQPLDDGYIFIGVANLQPIGNPINVYWDAALTIPAAQPIRTISGYPANAGTPARLYVNSDYSIQVQNKNGTLVYSSPIATERYGGGIINATDVVYDPPFTNAVSTTVADQLSQVVSVLDFGAVADGNVSTGAGTDNSLFFQNALDYCQANAKALYVPAGVYVLRSQITTGNQNRIIGAGMYRTILVAPTSFTGNGLIRMGGAGGPPSLVEHLAILGQISGGAGAGSIGLALAANAALAQHVWIGGFATQFAISGTDCRCIDCWADVSLASGTGFAFTNGGNSLLDCTTFNCYVGIDIQGGWTVAEPDIGIQITNCNIIQSGFSGITITNAAQNVFISNVMMHSPVTLNKFTRDFITIDNGCQNISINQVTATFGDQQSSTTTGIAINGQPSNVSITNCHIEGCNIACDIDQPLGLVVSGNQFVKNKLGGLRLDGGGPGAIAITGNVALSNGDAASFAANTSFGFWLDHQTSAGPWSVTGNSSINFTGIQYYAFYLNHTNNPYEVAFTGNSAQSDGVAYSYNGAGVAKIINQATNAS
jgi:hypothetical protein